MAAGFIGGEGEGEGGGNGEGGGGLTCLCLKPYSGCRLWPIAGSKTHSVRPGQTSGPSDCTETLLGSLSQLCATFFHANSWEAGVKVCLHWPSDESGAAKAQYRDLSADAKDKVRKCAKSQVAVVGRLIRTRHLSKRVAIYRGASVKLQLRVVGGRTVATMVVEEALETGTMGGADAVHAAVNQLVETIGPPLPSDRPDAVDKGVLPAPDETVSTMGDERIVANASGGAAAPAAAPSDGAPLFIPSACFDGARIGYVFTSRDRGVGYYWDGVATATDEVNPWHVYATNREDAREAPVLAMEAAEVIARGQTGYPENDGVSEAAHGSFDEEQSGEDAEAWNAASDAARFDSIKAMEFREARVEAREAVRVREAEVAAARAQEEEEELIDVDNLYAARYANCYRGNTDVNIHAEEVRISDTAQRPAVCQLPAFPVSP